MRSSVTSAFPQIADVFVTTDPAMVRRIAQIHGSMLAGTSVAGQIPEVMAIANAVAGTSGSRSLSGRPGTQGGPTTGGTSGTNPGGGGAR